jgi:hypothetical protein
MKSRGLILKVVAFCLAWAIPISLVDAAPRKVILRDGTVVVLRLRQPLSSETCEQDEIIGLEVVEDVKVDGAVVIARGATANAQVVQCEKAGMFGKAGKLRLTILGVKAVDQSTVPLRATAGRGGEEKTMLAVGGGAFFCPLLFFIKGKEAVYTTGSIFQTYVLGDKEIVVP